MESPVEKARCPWCGESLPDPDAVSCPSCHAALALGPMEMDPAGTPPPNPFGPAPGASLEPKPAAVVETPGAAAPAAPAPLSEDFTSDALPNPFGPAPTVHSDSKPSVTGSAPSPGPFGGDPDDEPFKPLSAAEPFGSEAPDRPQPNHPQASVGAFRSLSDDEPADFANPFSPGGRSEPSPFGSEPEPPAGFDLTPAGSDARASEIASHSPFGAAMDDSPGVGGSPFGDETPAPGQTGASPFSESVEDPAVPAQSLFGDVPGAHSEERNLPFADHAVSGAGEPEEAASPPRPFGSDGDDSPFTPHEPAAEPMNEPAPGSFSLAGSEENEPPLPASPFGSADEPSFNLEPPTAPAPDDVSAPAVDAPFSPAVSAHQSAPPPDATAGPFALSELPASDLPAPPTASDLPAPAMASELPSAPMVSDLPVPPVASALDAAPPAVESATGSSPFDLPHESADAPGAIPGATGATDPSHGFDFDFGPAAALPVLGGAMAAGAASGPPPSAAAFPAPTTPTAPIAANDASGTAQKEKKRAAKDRTAAPPGTSTKTPSKLVIPVALLGLVLILGGGGAYWMLQKGNGGPANDTTGGYPTTNTTSGYPAGNAAGGYPSKGPAGAPDPAMGNRPNVGGQRPSAGGAPLPAGGMTSPEGSGRPVQIYWRSATADYLKQHPGVDSPALRNGTGSTGAVVRVDIENFGSKTIRVRPQAFRLKVGSAAISPARGRLPDLLQTAVVPPKEAVRGWLFFNGQGIPSSLAYGGPIHANVSPSQYPNGPAGGQ